MRSGRASVARARANNWRGVSPGCNCIERLSTAVADPRAVLRPSVDEALDGALDGFDHLLEQSVADMRRTNGLLRVQVRDPMGALRDVLSELAGVL